MEKWESDLREKLERELTDHTYIIGSDPYSMGVSKADKIRFEVAIVRASMEMFQRDSRNIPNSYNNDK